MAEKLTRDDVAHVANLARLEISEQELNKYTEELAAILDYVDQLSSVDTTGVEPVSQVTGLTNILQADEPAADSVDRKEFLAGAPSSEDPYLKVKTVLDNV